MTFLDHLSGLLHLKCSQATTDPRVRSQSTAERKGVTAKMTKWASHLPVLTLHPFRSPVEQVVPLNRSTNSPDSKGQSEWILIIEAGGRLDK